MLAWKRILDFAKTWGNTRPLPHALYHVAQSKTHLGDSQTLKI